LTATYNRPELKTTVVFEWNYQSKSRINVNQGGSSAGKTIAILQVLFIKAIERKRVITVTAEDIPNLKKGAMRDAEQVVLSGSEWMRSFIDKFNKSERTYYFSNGSIIEFTSFDTEQDAKGSRRDILFVNEANGISYEIYRQLEMRTKEQVYIDYNPTTSFWAHTDVIGRTGTVVFYSNFTHNPYAPEASVRSIRALKERDPESWRVYGLGKTGDVQGLVFKGIQYVDDFPEGAVDVCYGIDFGFNDPTAIVKLGRYDGRIIGKELVYEYELTNSEIAERLRKHGITSHDDVFAESAEPKSIREINQEGFNLTPVVKGEDSIRYGIKLLKRLGLAITHDSTAWKKEQRNYKWKTDRDGRTMEKPVDSWNHLWDAARYAAMMKWGGQRTTIPEPFW
jgi:phage terminase large subunit